MMNALVEVVRNIRIAVVNNMDTREIINKLNFYKKELDTLRGSL